MNHPSEVIPARSEPHFFFSLHSLQLCETHKHTHINYPRSRNFLSLAQQLRSVINHFSGGTEADFSIPQEEIAAIF